MRRAAARSFVLSVLAAALAAPSASPAQRGRRGQPGEQTLFGPETPVERPSKLPEDVALQLLEFKENEADEEPTLKRCLREQGQTAADVARHFSASEIDLNGDAARDLVVQAVSRCFLGAHNTGWWVFSKVDDKWGEGAGDPGYDLVFSARGDGLSVLKTKTYGFRDIKTMNFTAAGAQIYYAVWKFDGSRYVPRVCTLDNDGRKNRVSCGL